MSSTATLPYLSYRYFGFLCRASITRSFSYPSPYPRHYPLSLRDRQTRLCIFPMASSARLLSLPRELRDRIYHYYLEDPDGYHFDFDSCKLRRSDGQHIDLSLMYTCTFIAGEMRGLALKINPAVFSTVSSERERLKAGMYDWQLSHMRSLKSTLRYWLTSALEYQLPPEIEEQLIAAHPECQIYFPVDPACLTEIKWDYYSNRFGIPESAYEAFQHDLLQHIATPSKLKRIVERINRKYPDNPSQQDRSAFFGSSLLFRKFVPWCIPSKDEVLEISRVFKPRLDEYDANPGGESHVWKQLRWNYSAAAAAIHFLGSLGKNARLQFRSMILREDHRAIRDAASHAIGLIPFCQENQDLRVERRVSLWRNVFLGIDAHLSHFESSTSLRSCWKWTYPFTPSRMSHGIVKWISEAIRLRALGMPSQSFRLDFDKIDEDLWDLNLRVWEIHKDDVAWQHAWVRKFGDGLVEQQHSDLAAEPWGRKVLDEIDKIMHGTSFIRCKFMLGELGDAPSRILEENQELHNLSRWNTMWRYKRSKNYIDVRGHLPGNWRDLRADPTQDLPLDPPATTEDEESDDDGGQQSDADSIFTCYSESSFRGLRDSEITDKQFSTRYARPIRRGALPNGRFKESDPDWCGRDNIRSFDVA